MKTLLKSALLAGIMFSFAPQAAMAAKSQPASSDNTVVVPGIAVANLDAVVANSNAYQTAENQRKVTYKAQLQAAKTRRDQITAQLKPLVEKFNTDRQAANPNQASLQRQAETIQQIQEAGKRELQKILEPVQRSQAYVNEQIEDKVDEAVKNAMTKHRISLLLSPQAVLAVKDKAYNLNQAILDELNSLLPAAQLVPPQGWEPRQVREARAEQEKQQQQSHTAGPQPQGR